MYLCSAKKEIIMVKDYKTMYKRLCIAAQEYDKGLIPKQDLTNELSYFILYKFDESINPYIKKLENRLERILTND